MRSINEGLNKLRRLVPGNRRPWQAQFTLAYVSLVVTEKDKALWLGQWILTKPEEFVHLSFLLPTLLLVRVETSAEVWEGMNFHALPLCRHSYHQLLVR